jgi:hypothetical protein
MARGFDRPLEEIEAGWKAEQDRLAALEHCPETCPACGSGDLHGASIGGEEAIACCDCVWAATIESFQPSGEADGK